MSELERSLDSWRSCSTEMGGLTSGFVSSTMEATGRSALSLIRVELADLVGFSVVAGASFTEVELADFAGGAPRAADSRAFSFPLPAGLNLPLKESGCWYFFAGGRTTLGGGSTDVRTLVFLAGSLSLDDLVLAALALDSCGGSVSGGVRRGDARQDGVLLWLAWSSLAHLRCGTSTLDWTDGGGRSGSAGVGWRKERSGGADRSIERSWSDSSVLTNSLLRI